MQNNDPSELTAFRSLARNWEVLGDTDPMFGVLSDPSRHGGKWDADTFFASGRDHVQALLRMLSDARVSYTPGTCLDFGCGVGRLTVPLSSLFQRTIGVDIAAPMIARARQLHAAASGCEFVVNRDPDLRRFADRCFDVVHSCLVLQHIPPGISVRYVAEFFRVAKTGGVVVFQLPADTRSLEQVAAASETLPPSAYQAELEVADAPSTLAPSQCATVRVRVINRSDITWRHDIPGGRHICVGNHWLHEDGSRAVDDDGRAFLPHPIGPGAAVEIPLRVQAPETVGRYLLEIDLVQEHVSWFSRHGSRTARRAVVVEGDRPNADPQDTPVAAVAAAVAAVVPPPLAPIGGPASPSTSLFARLLRRLKGGTPTFEMHVVPRAEVERVIRESGGELVRAVDDNAAGPGWLSYTYICRRR